MDVLNRIKKLSGLVEGNEYHDEAFQHLDDIGEYLRTLPSEVSHWVSNLNTEEDGTEMIKAIIEDLNTAIAQLKSYAGMP